MSEAFEPEDGPDTAASVDEWLRAGCPARAVCPSCGLPRKLAAPKKRRPLREVPVRPGIPPYDPPSMPRPLRSARRRKGAGQ
jgi:hypothetical protein